MSIIRTVGLTLAVVIGTALITGARPSTPTPLAEKYFGCPSGYAFQTSGNHARCYLAGTTATADIYCGVGYVKALDQFNGGKDACQNKMSNVVGNYTCPSGYNPKVQPGPDMCIKPSSPSIVAPQVVKNL